MPVPNYNGETFVAFTDISGFKEMMKHDNIAVKAIDHFYSCGYKVLRQNQGISGFFVSDCGILFVRNHDYNHLQKLRALIDVIQQLNRQLLEYDIMLSTSIAFGQFKYNQRIEFEGIEKNPIYGQAYVSAFLDNEAGKPKIQPGQCRIIKKNLCNISLNSINCIEEERRYWYFYWMADSPEDITDFKKRYLDTYQLKYNGMLKVLKDSVNIGTHRP
jgi:hypothetical protein